MDCSPLESCRRIPRRRTPRLALPNFSFGLQLLFLEPPKFHLVARRMHFRTRSSIAFEVDGRIYIKLPERGALNSRNKKWDDGAGGQLKQILLWHDKYFISGIQTICERNGVKQISMKHGGTEGNFEMINPRKPLTWVSGHYGSYCIDPELIVGEEEAPWNYYKVITSLKFGNEEETYGPFGDQNGTSFVFRAGSEITGFHGSSSDASSNGFGYISTIGVYFRTEAVCTVREPSRSSTAN